MRKLSYALTIILLISFIVFTIIVKCVDVKPLGINETNIGLSTFNISVRDKIPYNETWYKITKYFGYLWFVVCGLFAAYGIYLFIKNKSLKKIDYKLYILFSIFLLAIILYISFEFIKINYRPILEDGKMELSYPSSHTLLSIAIFVPSALYIIDSKFNKIFKYISVPTLLILAILIVVGRFLSGVHWATDIFGGIILGSFLISLYISIDTFLENKFNKEDEIEK